MTDDQVALTSPAPRGLPLVAIVGRPNVGKSTLFNRLSRSRLAIVHDEPGVTRDRHYADTSAFGRGYTLIDTGGFDPDSDDPMRAGITGHVKAAIAEADVIVFVTDVDPNEADRAAVALLRAAGKPVIYSANKADTPRDDAAAFEVYRLGVDKVIPVSALHGRGIGDLEAAIVEALPRAPEEPPAEDERLTRIAIIGRPNAGKSSLLNRLLGEDRMLVDDRPGTTHDCIDVVVTRKAADGDRRYVFIDTAGIRRKGRVTKAEDAVESLSVMQAIRSIERAHVVVLVVDANDGVAEQDAKILGLAEDRGRAMIIALNKNDLLDREEGKKIEELARDKISFVPYAPVVRLSAKTGRGVGELMRTVDQVRASFQQRISTGELNRFFAEVLEHRPPPTMGGRAPRFYYITQAEHSPPTFVVMTNAPDSVHFSYQRFVVNQLRKRFGFEGAPVRIVYKAKRQTPAAERVRLRAQAAGRPSHKPARRDPEDEASQAKAGPPREKSKTAGPPREKSEKAGPPREKSKAAGPPREKSKKAGPHREKSEKAGPPREKSKAAGPKKTTRPPRRERKPHSK